MAREAKGKDRQANRCFLFCSNDTNRRQVRRRKTRPFNHVWLNPTSSTRDGLKKQTQRRLQNKEK